jgi:hypothetical protein
VVAAERSPADRAARLATARKLMTVGAVAIATGVALVGTISRDVGGVVLIFAWLLMIGAIHTFGRA